MRIKKIKLCCIIIAAAVMASSAYELNVTRTVVTPITNFNLGFFDVTGSGTGQTLFLLNLKKGGTGDKPVSIHLTIICSTNVAEGVVYDGKTSLIDLPGANTQVTIPSNDFLNAKGGLYSLDTAFIVLEESEIQEKIENSGAIPTGAIKLVFELWDEHDNIVPSTAEKSLTIQIVNIRYVRPITPGIPAGYSGEWIPEVFTQFPEFAWGSDLVPVQYREGFVKFEISIYENPDNMIAIRDIPNTEPLWRTDLLSNFTYYPTTGVKPLEKGKIYYWQVKAILIGPVNTELASELYRFKISNINYLDNLTENQKELLRYLERILGQ
ncbi:MAG: hypothetical protein ABIA63_06715 [bacterium]